MPHCSQSAFCDWTARRARRAPAPRAPTALAPSIDLRRNARLCKGTVARMDAFAAMEARRATGSTESNAVMGRGATAGWVRCPLCSARRQKRFARGRGLQMHLDAAHGDATAAEKAAAVVAADAAGARSGARTGAEGWAAAAAAKRRVPAACAAARDGDVATLVALRASGAFTGVDVAHRDAHGYRAHHWAAGTAGGALAWLLDVVPARDVDALTRRERREGKRGSRSVLHWACRNGVAGHVALLLRRGDADFEPSADGTTPLMLALYKGAVDCCELLHAAGARVLEDANDWRCDDAHWAAMGDDPEPALAWLRGRVGAPAWRDALGRAQAQGHTVFHKAAQRGRAKALGWLLREAAAARADLSAALAPDASGRTPAQVARAAGFDDAAAVLEPAERRLRRPGGGALVLAAAGVALAAVVVARLRT